MQKKKFGYVGYQGDTSPVLVDSAELPEIRRGFTRVFPFSGL